MIRTTVFSLSHRVRLLIGLLGSLAVLAGSMGVGWLAPASVLRTLPLFDLVRTSRAAVVLCTFLLAAGLLLLLFAWLSLGLALRPNARTRKRTRANAPSPLRQVVASTIVWAAPLIVALPLFSRDMFAYLGQGRILVAGLDPYTDTMADVPGWFEAGVDIKWAETVTPYGPLFVLLARIVVVATSWLPMEAALIGVRLLAVAGLAMVAYYGWRIARLRGFNEAAVLWAVACSPLVLMNFVLAGHNDALMLGLIVAGVYWAMRDRPILATVLVTAAIGIKPIAMIALPIIGIIWAGSTATWGALIRRWAAVAGLALVGLLGLGLGLGVGIGWVAGLGTPIEIGSWYSIPRIVSLFARDFGPGLGLDGDVARTAVVRIFLFVGCLVAAYLVTVKRRSDPLWLLAGVFSALVLFSPLQHPWYGLWLITLFGIAGLGRAWQVRLLIYVTAFLMFVGISGEQVDLIERLRADASIPIVYGWIGVIGIVLIVAAFEFELFRRFTRPGLPLPMLARATPADSDGDAHAAAAGTQPGRDVPPTVQS